MQSKVYGASCHLTSKCPAVAGSLGQGLAVFRQVGPKSAAVDSHSSVQAFGGSLPAGSIALVPFACCLMCLLDPNSWTLVGLKDVFG